eukprot:TRINITY_DN7443_c0_g1_i2.p1 TRINITY_DN7443_c0_g1~~TRINITY_DN7443_c0_g1_i2.p1  ORF type:complete len:542 (+),score=96.94 TRINITY_DN7443_c0_g1_i2:67-1692(+)
MPRPPDGAIYVDVGTFKSVHQQSADRVVEQLELLRAGQAETQLKIITILEALTKSMSPAQPLPEPQVDILEAAVLLNADNEKNIIKAASQETAPSDICKSKPKVSSDTTCQEASQQLGQGKLKVSAVDLTPMHVEGRSMLSWGVGYSGKRKLLQYNFDKLYAFGALPAAFAECSIFRLRRTLVVQVLLQPLVIMLIFGITRAFLLTTEEDPGAVREMLAPFLSLTESMKELVAFFLGLFIALQLKRHWTIRSIYMQRIFFATAQLSWFLGAVVPPQAEALRQKLERYFLMAHRIIYHCARQEHHLLHVLEKELLTPDELHHINSEINGLPEGARHPIGVADMDLAELPLMWTAQIAYRMFLLFKTPEFKAWGLEISPPIILKMVNLCMEVRHGIQDIEMILTSPVPFPYVHLVCLVVQGYTIFTCLESGILLGTQSEVPPAVAFLSQMIVVTMINSIYLALLCLTTVLDNPFTDEVIDFPAANLQSRLWKSQIFARAMLFQDADVDDEVRRMIMEHPDFAEQGETRDSSEEEEEQEYEDGE